MEILDRVARDHMVTVDDLVGRSRASHLNDARSDFCHRAYYGSDLTLQQIGDLIGGRHYRTVRYLIDRYELRNVRAA